MGQGPAAPANSAAGFSEKESQGTALETPPHLCPSGNSLAVAVARGMAWCLQAAGREEQAHEFLARGRLLEKPGAGFGR